MTMHIGAKRRFAHKPFDELTKQGRRHRLLAEAGKCPTCGKKKRKTTKTKLCVACTKAHKKMLVESHKRKRTNKLIRNIDHNLPPALFPTAIVDKYVG